MSEITKKIKESILAEGVDLVGIADANNLILASPPRPATAIMPTAKSVIVMAVAHSLGATCAADIKIWTRNKMQTSRLLDQVAEKIGRSLERDGYLSVPISADKPVEIHKFDPVTGKKFKRTRVIGQFSLKHAAISAGLGRMGRSNLLLTPEFGPHQRLGAIITEAPLEPDARMDGDPCPSGCCRCEVACPVGALKDGAYSIDPCFWYWSMGFEKLKPAKLSQWPGFIKMLLEHNRRRDTMVEAGQTFITDVDHCIECMKACPIGKRWAKIRPR